jgi:hypothetical protein
MVRAVPSIAPNGGEFKRKDTARRRSVSDVIDICSRRAAKSATEDDAGPNPVQLLNGVPKNSGGNRVTAMIWTCCRGPASIAALAARKVQTMQTKPKDACIAFRTALGFGRDDVISGTDRSPSTVDIWASCRSITPGRSTTILLNTPARSANPGEKSGVSVNAGTAGTR